MTAREYDKLVRDRIPEIIEADGGDPTTHIAEGDEYADRLAAKLREEVTEYLDRRDPDELVDILEVVHAIREHEGLSVEELERQRRDKATRRGRFEEGIVLERVE